MEYECASFHMIKRIELTTQPSCLLGLIWYSAQFADTQLQWLECSLFKNGGGFTYQGQQFLSQRSQMDAVWCCDSVSPFLLVSMQAWGEFLLQGHTTTHRSCQRSTALGPLLQLRTGTSKLWSKQTVSLLSKEWPKIGGNRPTRLCLETLSPMKSHTYMGMGARHS